MNPSGFLVVGVLVLLIGITNGASLQKRWIPERMSDNDYGFDNQQHQTTSDDLAAYQPNYMNYFTDYYPGGYSGGDYSGMMFRAGGQAPAPGQIMMDPAQQLQNVQAYSYAQQLQQQYPNGLPLPYRPQPSPYQPYQPYQQYQPGPEATGRALALLSLLNQKRHQQFMATNPMVVQNSNFAVPAFTSAISQPQQLVLVEPEETKEIEAVEVVDTSSFSFPVNDIQTDDALVLINALDSTNSETNQHSAILTEGALLEMLQQAELEDSSKSEVLAEVLREEILTDLESKPVSLAEAEALKEVHSHSIATHNTHAKETKETLKEEMLLEAALAEIAEAGKIQEHTKQATKTQANKKISKAQSFKGRAGGSGDYIDPNVYANYGGASGLVDMASPLDLVYPGAMVPAQSYPPVSPTYYPYASPNPYLIPPQVYQPPAYSQASSGPYGAPVLPYQGYPTIPSYYNAQPPLRYTRNSAAALPMPFVVKYVYGAVPMNLPQSG